MFRFTAPAGTDASALRDLVTAAKGSAGVSGAVIVGTVVDDGKASVVVAIDAAAKSAGKSAVSVLQAMLPALEGRGGGSPDMAQGAGARVDGLDAALHAAADALAG